MNEKSKNTIRQTMQRIQDGKYLLPGIQRKFVWKTEQIERLFDSLLQEYPINSFMLWRVEDEEIRKNYKFYHFLRDYAEKYHEDNEPADARLKDAFWAVIDGQQRLTSLYIGLTGTYRYKLQNKWWKDSEENLPTRKLYLNLTAPLTDDVEDDKYYDFKFKTEREVAEDTENYWFEVGQILNMNEPADVVKFVLSEDTLRENQFALNTLTQLFMKINLDEQVLSYHEITEQDQNKVLNIFIRTNSGGTQLSFSDLLTSITAANWQKYDIRKELSEVRKEIREFGPAKDKFEVSQDLILKSMLVLTPGCSVRFKIENFGQDNIAEFERNWPKIRASLVATFELLEQLGFSDSLLRAKNAAIPIAYYICQHELWDKITKTTYSPSDKTKIARWLSLSLVKKIFGGQSDTVLTEIRKVLQDSKSAEFPLADIIDHFRSSSAKNYALDDGVIDGLLAAEYQTPMASLVLGLLYPQVLVEHGSNVAQDHMHPKTNFEDAEKFAQLELNDTDGVEDVREFAQEKYNTVLNLQLLDGGRNGSKLDADLAGWAKNTGRRKQDLLVDEDTSLDIKDFAQFIQTREKNLKTRLEQILTIDT